MHVRLVAPAVTALLSLSAATGASAAKVKLVTEKAPSTKIGTVDPKYGYASGETVWAKCKGSGTPLMLGWSGVRAPVAIMYANNLEKSKILGFAMRRTLGRGATVKTRVLCARGKVKAKVKYSTSGKVNCGKGRVAIGVPINGGPYWVTRVTSVPVGTRGWRSKEGDSKYTQTVAICVASSAFRSVKVVSKRARFKVGSDTTRVTATCRKGTQPISWGYEADVIDGNRWQTPNPGLAAAMAVPFVSSAMAKGRTGWSLTFATPDAKPARSAAALELVITCAKPR
jgi:hypothetical protein